MVVIWKIPPGDFLVTEELWKYWKHVTTKNLLLGAAIQISNSWNSPERFPIDKERQEIALLSLVRLLSASEWSLGVCWLCRKDLVQPLEAHLTPLLLRRMKCLSCKNPCNK